jgi:predicted MFS family arabinose efflux permease
VPRDQIRRVVALNAVQFNVSRSLGPALSGWIVDHVGIAMCYFTNALSYLFVVVPLLFIKASTEHVRSHQGRSFFESFTESFRYLRTRPDLMIVETVVFLIAFCSAPVMTMLPALTERVFHGDASDYSHLLSAMGAGALCAALLNAVQAKRLMTVGHALPRVLALGVVLMALGWTQIYAIALFLMFSAGLVLVGVGNLMQATVISSVPSHLHGRIAGMHVLCFSIGVPLGSFIDGFAAEKFGVASIFAASGLLLCVGVSGLIWVYRHRKIEMDHGTPQETST